MSNPFKLSALEPVGYGIQRRSQKVAGFPFGTNPLAKKEGHGLEQRIASQNCELQPAFLNSAQKGSFYTNGRGYSVFGAFPPYLA